ncbi:hypothetical protein KIF24_07160 [Micromonospora sp. Llam7]|uniref:hypothetical protein n=1 Tax=Micromonospora tarapacensis TaxID=2835305 RepID=UPI001C835776|nr:hypothetical protein [Micromonospora tarapacensis]MBX7265829.1 hypothetical protein [Micromonospora tarapacensis]
MDLDIKPEVFIQGDKIAVVKLLELLMHERHEWRPDKTTADSAARFADTLPFDGVKVFVEEAFIRATSTVSAPQGRRAPITAAELKDLVADLSRPAVLVVEDEISEECFLLALAEAFNEKRIVQAIRADWLTVGHAGGKDRMPLFVERRRRQFAILVRLAALMDSDRKYAGHRTRNDTYAAKIRAIDGVELHLWGCREMENYIPCRAWEESLPTRMPKVDALRGKSAEERRYLDVKEHFGAMPRPLIAEHTCLTEEDFAELGPEVVAELRRLLAMIHRIL